MARKHILNQDGTPNWDTIAGFKERLDGHDGSLAQKTHYNDVVYLADYITNFDKTATSYTNCDTALTNAIAACKSGGTLILPTGLIYVSSQFNITKPMTIIGGTGTSTCKIEASGYNDLFYVDSSEVHFINLTIEHTAYFNSANYATMQSGDYTGIRFHSGRRHIVDKCTIIGFSTNIHFENCDFFSVTNNYLTKSFNYGIVVENQTTPDSGDSIIHGNVITGSVTTSVQSTACIKQRSGGGLKISDNKLLTGQVGIQLLIPSNVQTGVFIVEGNSVEGQTLHCLQMGYETGATNSTFVRSIINGNEFLANLVTSDAVSLDGSIIPYSMKDVLFQGNQIAGVPITSGINGLYINGITNITVSDNEIYGGFNGISIQSYTTNIIIRDNMILKNGSTAIKNSGYANMGTAQISNMKHTTFVAFTNNSLTNAVNTVLASYSSSPAIASFKMTVDIVGNINTPSAEKFYVHQEYFVYSSLNGSNYNSATLINSTSSGLPITVVYNSSGIVTVTRNDAYADQTYTISGTAKVTVDGILYNVGSMGGINA